MKFCELCNREAKLYCYSDAAFLCFQCDSNVHNANFLVARHLRRFVCSRCNSLSGNPFSGTKPPSLCQFTCLSSNCSRHQGTELKESSSSFSSTSCSSTLSSGSACVSSTETTSSSHTSRKGEDKISDRLKRRRSLRSEGVFANWCKRLGLNGNSIDLTIKRRARQALEWCSGGSRIRLALPFRVSLAASFWFGIRLCGDKTISTWQNLRRLEEVSGVPSKLIVAVEMKINNVLRSRRSQLEQEESAGTKEGWAECSV